MDCLGDFNRRYLGINHFADNLAVFYGPVFVAVVILTVNPVACGDYKNFMIDKVLRIVVVRGGGAGMRVDHPATW